MKEAKKKNSLKYIFPSFKAHRGIIYEGIVNQNVKRNLFKIKRNEQKTVERSGKLIKMRPFLNYLFFPLCERITKRYVFYRKHLDRKSHG